MSTRREFIVQSATVGLAFAVGCKSAPEAAPGAPVDPLAVPAQKPAAWDPVAYNTARGAAGAIPAAYMKDIGGEDGVNKHLGKHLPYVPANLPEDRKVAGRLPIMWGDPAQNHAKHPNAPKSEKNPEGHWYNWIRIAKDGDEASQVETVFDNWPQCSEGVNGRLVGCVDPDPAAEDGKNSVYLAILPAGIKAGDTVRIWAHCLTHGEYVDFMTVPEGYGA